jgi:3-deoxy-D-manno-octulosonic-acid transferase
LALLEDPARRTRMGEAGRQQVGEHAGALGRTLDLLDDVLAGRRA